MAQFRLASAFSPSRFRAPLFSFSLQRRNPSFRSFRFETVLRQSVEDTDMEAKQREYLEGVTDEEQLEIELKKLLEQTGDSNDTEALKAFFRDRERTDYNETVLDNLGLKTGFKRTYGITREQFLGEQEKAAEPDSTATLDPFVALAAQRPSLTLSNPPPPPPTPQTTTIETGQTPIVMPSGSPTPSEVGVEMQRIQAEQRMLEFVEGMKIGAPELTATEWQAQYQTHELRSTIREMSQRAVHQSTLCPPHVRDEFLNFGTDLVNAASRSGQIDPFALRKFIAGRWRVGFAEETRYCALPKLTDVFLQFVPFKQGEERPALKLPNGEMTEWEGKFSNFVMYRNFTFEIRTEGLYRINDELQRVEVRRQKNSAQILGLNLPSIPGSTADEFIAIGYFDGDLWVEVMGVPPPPVFTDPPEVKERESQREYSLNVYHKFSDAPDWEAAWESQSSWQHLFDLRQPQNNAMGDFFKGLEGEEGRKYLGDPETRSPLLP
uniref:Uncharacterized protein n=1 Tax=Chromera velia CCMP2878 TaxID=1169474 RepID=A0A0G4G3N5_9ALVE|eukprot:Cvel_20125.t1-p1 / transcript=Cvel_20125.t1 / gene=Cvel_20125 / organism=Chromera_velia_CCMP2878 / gene_product=hypothetical protein / transcript_product=hypothetical protein / location=Cvel_scaffold1784:26684-28159(-) / protein_length=492 / sequence_SO=supercontig / SO=protein_coding / is_pseudo=false